MADGAAPRQTRQARATGAALPMRPGGVMTFDPRGVSFLGCRNREEVMARFTVWLDAYYEDQLLTIAAGWLDNADLADLADCAAQLRASFMRNRNDNLA